MFSLLTILIFIFYNFNKCLFIVTCYLNNNNNKKLINFMNVMINTWLRELLMKYLLYDILKHLVSLNKS